MVSIREYLTESHYKGITMDKGTAGTLIKRDCKKYLGLLKGKEPLRRGMTISLQDGILFKRSVRQDRKARLTVPERSGIANKWLEKNKHVRRDRAVIASSKERKVFGYEYYIFPIGKFNYTWIRGKDWNFRSEHGWDGAEVGILGPGKIIEMLDKQQRDGNIVTNKGWDNMYKNGFEVWMDCKEYYFIERHYLTKDVIWK
jgi:hypothetical protein